MKINTEKFLKWLDERITETYKVEMSANKSEHPIPEDYLKSFAATIDRNTYEYIKFSITGEHNTDIGDFMEE